MKKRERILIVEDELINRNILKKILSDNYEILEAVNGEEAWQIIKEEQQDIAAVLTDIAMPVMDGYELLERIQREQMSELPVIVMTASTDDDSEKKALDMGAWDFVTKPYNPKILTRRLENALSRRQITMLKKMEKMAAHDALTGLHNRSRFFEKAQTMIELHSDITFQFLRIDIDHFSLYNSAFGEEEGNRLICFIAAMGREFAKKYEQVEIGRISADIFGMCIPYSVKQEELEVDIQFVQEQLSRYRENYLLEVSVGVYVIENNEIGMQECYRRATLAAQQCKSRYGKHIGYYDEEEGKREHTEVAIANEMQKALNEHQFVVYLQPKYDITKEAYCGAEALVRWNHPEKGLISPGIFIPVFERNGFISELDYFVWEETCKMLNSWMTQGYKIYPVSINISRVSLNNPRLVEILNELVEKYEIGHEFLQLEITESAYMSNPEHMKGIVNKLSGAGFTLLMDDFGSDYSSLNTLKNIKVDVLKIDLKFLEMGEDQKKGEIILASVVKMAKWLGMQVVVEGVETREQRDFLEGTGCKYVQGYYYARPMPREEYEKHYVFANIVNADYGTQTQNRAMTPAHNITILVIDDDAGTRAAIRGGFSDKYHVQECEDAESALLYLHKNAKTVHLILVDNVMHGMSGMDFLIYCKDDKELAPIPKILITAERDEKTQVEAFENGVYDYITKPLIMQTVKARVEHVMGIGNQIRMFEERDMIDTEMYQSILDASQSIITVVDANNLRGLYANAAARQMVKNHWGDFVGNTCHRFVYGLDRPCDFCIVNHTKEDTFVNEELEMNGRYYRQVFKHISWRGQDAILEYTTDITELVKNRDIIERQKQLQDDILARQKELFDTIPSGILEFIFDGKHAHILSFNQTLLDMIGYDKETFSEHQKWDLTEVVHPEDYPLLRKAQESITLGKGLTYDFRLVNKKTGVYRWISCDYTITERTKQGVKVISAFLDIEDKRKAEDASAAKSRFLSRMSHEIRTPINAIMGMAELGREDVNSGNINTKVLTNYFDETTAASKYLLTLVNDVLDTSRIESNKIDLNPIIVNASEFLQNMSTLITPLAEQKGITLVTERKTTIGEYFKGDPVRVKQILVNLLNNAIKFTPRGGTISFISEAIETNDKTTTLRFTVIDDGIGMTEEFQKTLFLPFTQENTSTTSPFEGTGLGLSIARSLTRQMGGDIICKSKKDVGTTFIVTFVVGNAKTEDIPEAKILTESVDTIDIQGVRVLLCEDHPLNQKIAKALLERRKCVVDIANNGAEGVRMFEKSPEGYYSIIYMDIRMPELDGLEATKRIRELERSDATTIPIIAMSANAYEEDVRKSLSAGMNDHLAKPVDPDKLYKTTAFFTNQTLSAISPEKRKILVVDDIEMSVALMKKVLGAEYEVMSAENGKEALEILSKNEDIVLVITDLRMPVMDGIELIKIMRNDHRFDHVAIIANTQYGDPKQEEELLSMGADDFVYKPITPRIVATRVRYVLARYQHFYMYRN